MSDMRFMEKLLDGVEVEWKSFGDVAKVQRGASPRPIAKYITEDENGIPWIKIGDTSSGLKYVKKTAQRITPDGAKKSRILKKGDFILSNSMSFGRPYILDINGAIHDGWASISDFSEHLNSDYLYHFLSSKNVQNYWVSKINSGSVSNLNADLIKALLIPIPCPNNPKKSLEIQAEIVRILDTFTELTTELITELNARKTQYNYYRDELLSFEEGGVEWKTLGDVTKKWYSGGTPRARTPEYYEGGDIPWLRTQEVKFSDIERTQVKVTQAALDNSSAKWIPENCVIIAISGATAGRSAINKIPLTTNQHCGCLEIDSTKALYRYVFHWVSLNYENIKSLGQGARGDLNSSIIKNFKLPIPFAEDPEKSLAEQARIVVILDKFDALTSSITEGLPREIALRQQQYEYYRDLLLSFPKPDAEVAA
ncbi:MAG: type I restriction enzyme S subunit [Kiritimatiellia bacterium]|jgi:type I restriction enzyme S subunit